MNDITIRTAVTEWLSDSAAAEATYGHISTWETGGVTDMDHLFCADSWFSSCNTAAASFNEDIGAWDTSGVTTMSGMFYEASAFNQDIGAWDTSAVRAIESMFKDASAFDQDIGGWAVHSVTDMRWMFAGASAFDQDLGWCVDDDVIFKRVNDGGPFDGTPCESTSCGVKQGALEENGNCQSTSALASESDGAAARAAALVPIVLFII